MKKTLFLIISMLCLLMLAGCGSDKQAAAPAAEKVLRVATSPASPPFELYLKDQNKFTGFDIDLMNDLGKKMGYDKVEFVNVEFQSLLTGLDSKDYDLAVNNFSSTKERREKYAYSEPYAKAAFSIVAKKSSKLTMNDIAGRKVAIKKGASAARVAKALPNAQIVEYPQNGVCRRDLCKFVLLVSLDVGLFFDIAEVEADELFVFAALFVILQSYVKLLDELVIIFVGIHYQVILTVGVTNNS